MPALNFHKRFAPDVKRGKKRQTIRAKRKNPIKVGDRLYLYTAQRTTYCKKLREVICKSTVPIKIRFSEGHDFIFIPDASYYTLEELNRSAQQDGFKNWDDMKAWWSKTHGGEVFEGDLIKW